MRLTVLAAATLAWAVATVSSCGGDNTSDRIGIAGECIQDTDCRKVDDIQLTCLTMFKGGYCGLAGCQQDEDCPLGSVCINEAGVNYCFRECVDKPECNANRTVDNEANCVASVTRVGASTSKVCVPPSGS